MLKMNGPKPSDWLPDDGEAMNISRFGEGNVVLHVLDTLLIEKLIEKKRDDRPSEFRHMPPVMTAYTRWRWHRIQTKHLMRPNPEGYLGDPLWSIINFYRPTLDPPGSDIWAQSLNHDKPHLIATLAEENKLKEGVALTSEVQAILVLACTYGVKVHSHHQLIPVTLLTCSWNTCRVVQGIVDLRTRRVELRISNNVDLEGGARNNWPKVHTLLGWLLAQPLGETT